MTDAQRVGAAIVGLGWWGSTIAANLADSTHIRPVLGVDPDAVRRAEIEGRGVRTTDSFEKALADPEVEAVILCTPHALHAQQIIAAAAAGKHVFSEKPFTVTSAEATAALAAAREAGVHVGIGHERRFEPAVQQMQRLVADGDLGTLLVFEGNFSQDKFLSLPPDNWRLSATAAPVGPLSATGIHLVDLAISVLGEPVDVWARLGTLATSFGNGDTLTVTLGFASGATACITAVLATPFIGRVCLIGSEGWYEIRDRSHPERSTGWDVRLARRDADIEETHLPPFSGVRENLERFARGIRGEAPYPVAARDIQRNVNAFEAIVRSASSGRIEHVRAS
ncbi:Gfo/Idh/MocA family protein [Microbacterium sp. RD1]|uniref:Gfo/Idh/MocA family protein n=1 Tax=Microbacterium sp. RD1 TaxID=3457313 RepID=UPI003FA5822D